MPRRKYTPDEKARKDWNDLRVRLPFWIKKLVKKVAKQPDNDTTNALRAVTPLLDYFYEKCATKTEVTQAQTVSIKEVLEEFNDASDHIEEGFNLPVIGNGSGHDHSPGKTAKSPQIDHAATPPP